MSTTNTEYRSRYGYSLPLPDLVTADDLANVESSLSNRESTVPDPKRAPRYEEYSAPGERPKELPNGERILRFDQLTHDQQHARITKRLNEISLTRHQTSQHAKEYLEHDRRARTCRWCNNLVAKPGDLGMITWNGIDHALLCIECIAVAFTLISVQGQTIERVEIVLDRLGLTDQR